jgi:arylsulfatase A-like enzyme
MKAAFRCICGLLAAVIGLIVSVQAPAAEAGARKPNVLIIVADDLGYADLGFQGGKEIPTPHLDALARAGVRCTDGYASCPVCSPTRAGLMTGRYQQRFGHEYNPGVGKDVGLPVTETTLAELLRSAAYATGAVGKWHLGKEPQFHPLRRGFDAFYGFLGGAHYYVPTKGDPSDPFARAYGEPLLRDHDRVEEPAHLTEALGQEAVAFIDRRKTGPFFLYLAFNAVHVPLQSTDAYLDRFRAIEPRPRRTYAAMLAAMDDAVGLVAGKLEAEGLDRDTLVVFLSDNGGHPAANAARNDPLRDQKSTVFEGGIRVPFVVKWTGHIPAGRVYSEPVTSLDILPTALAAAGIAPPPRLSLDGVDLLPYLTSRTDRPPHETLYWRYGHHRAIRHGRWKLTMPAGAPAGLYDLSTDVAESKDLSAAHPEIVEDLAWRYAAWDSGLKPPRWRDLFMKDAPGPRTPPAPSAQD